MTGINKLRLIISISILIKKIEIKLKHRITIHSTTSTVEY
jgi:hypothetical protein